MVLTHRLRYPGSAGLGARASWDLFPAVQSHPFCSRAVNRFQANVPRLAFDCRPRTWLADHLSRPSRLNPLCLGRPRGFATFIRFFRSPISESRRRISDNRQAAGPDTPPPRHNGLTAPLRSPGCAGDKTRVARASGRSPTAHGRGGLNLTHAGRPVYKKPRQIAPRFRHAVKSLPRDETIVRVRTISSCSLTSLHQLTRNSRNATERLATNVMITLRRVKTILLSSKFR